MASFIGLRGRIYHAGYYKWNRAKAAFTRYTIGAPGENIALGRHYNVVDLNRGGRLDVTAPSKLGLWVVLNEGFAR